MVLIGQTVGRLTVNWLIHSLHNIKRQAIKYFMQLILFSQHLNPLKVPKVTKTAADPVINPPTPPQALVDLPSPTSSETNELIMSALDYRASEKKRYREPCKSSQINILSHINFVHQNVFLYCCYYYFFLE